MKYLKVYNKFNESVDYKKLSNQLKECYVDLQDMGLVVNLDDNLMDGLDDGSRFKITISKYDFYSDVLEFDRLSSEEMERKVKIINSDEGIFIMNDEILNVIEVANSYCHELEIRPGEILYNSFDPKIDDESELHCFDNVKELSKYSKYGNKVQSIEQIYVFEK